MPTAPRILIGLSLSVGLHVACGEPEPVLRGLPEQQEPPLSVAPLLQDALEPERDDDHPEKVASKPYIKPKGVYVDVRHLGGRGYSTVQVELADQMGDIQEQMDLGTRYGEEIVFTRGALRMVRDVIYMVRVFLPRPVTRGEALEMTGFPPYVDNWLITHREFRLGHSWDFRRIIMKRAKGHRDHVIQVDAWKERPDKAGH